jgi:small neutral amino acid transporter SnatA (MarC family)
MTECSENHCRTGDSSRRSETVELLWNYRSTPVAVPTIAVPGSVAASQIEVHQVETVVMYILMFTKIYIGDAG